MLGQYISPYFRPSLRFGRSNSVLYHLLSSIRVQLVDDHAIVREGQRMLLSEESDIEVVGEAGDGAESVKLAAMLQPHIAMQSIRSLPGTDCRRRP